MAAAAAAADCGVEPADVLEVAVAAEPNPFAEGEGKAKTPGTGKKRKKPDSILKPHHNYCWVTKLAMNVDEDFRITLNACFLMRGPWVRFPVTVRYGKLVRFIPGLCIL